VLELNLRSGTVVAFDGRVVEVFADGGSSRRFHIAHLDAPEAVEGTDGVRRLALENGTVTLTFACEEAPACARLLAAMAEARAALAQGD
jgi:hypothetical protein